MTDDETPPAEPVPTSDSPPARQEKGPATQLIVVNPKQSGIREQHFPEAMRFLAEVGLRGSQPILQVLGKWSDDLNDQIARLTEELRASREREQTISNELRAAEKQVVRLETLLQGEQRNAGFRALVIALGALVVGFAPYAQNATTTVALTVIGGVAIAAGCLLMIGDRSRK